MFEPGESPVTPTPDPMSIPEPLGPLRLVRGQLFGIKNEYRIDAYLGGGGSGDVYKAFEVSLLRPVAIKFFKNVHNREEFEREARLLAKAAAGHLNFVEIYRISDESEPPYMVMQFVEQSLDDAMRTYGGKLEPIKALRYAIGVGAALQRAHDIQIMHRDVKPANILLLEGGDWVKLSDFGLAREFRPGESVQDDLAGTPDYLAPEILQQTSKGRPESDVFSLGVTLYEMLAGLGRYPYELDRKSTLRNVLGKVVLLEERLPNLPESLYRAVKIAVARDPSQRFSSAAEFVDALKIALVELQTIGQAAGQVPLEPRGATAPTVPMAQMYPQLFVKTADQFTLVHFDLGPDPVDVEDLSTFLIPSQANERQHLGIILSGRLPIWLYVYLAHKAHIFAWLAVYDPRLGGAVVVERHRSDAPEVGSIISIANPNTLFAVEDQVHG
ncbi:MAG: CRISPR-associated protein Csx3 [Candidatus Hydrogenedentes bacterium]|nr:CRISPR-associated protein Csx3 [Candidatus Hydrogenedentota bacterium]